MSKSSELKDSLTFYRTTLPRIIPRELIENIKHCNYTPDEFYRYHENQYDPYTNEKNPDIYLYVLADKEKKVCGFFWAEISSVDNTLFLNNMRVDKKSWNRGEAVPLFIDLIKKIVTERKCKKTVWITTNPKFYEKFGFRQSKHVMMEYEGLDLSKKIEDKIEKAYNNKKVEA